VTGLNLYEAVLYDTAVNSYFSIEILLLVYKLYNGVLKLGQY
jgi:hypothetical protein